ncbi:unnamed protein product [marine sediment metagenome]|uniref:Uncharacterized protein n=1 Tax=marine sediment metagenome TaxID=412755 RepID=X0V4V4_9ZZZZ
MAKAHERWKPTSEINESDIIHTAQTVAYNRAISDLICGGEVTWEEMQGKASTKVTFDGPPPSPETEGEIRKEEIQRAEIGQMLLEMSAGDREKGADILEGVTEWTNDKGELIPGRRDIRQLTLKQMGIVHHKVKAEFNTWKENT